jgi:hypothetical protein
VGSLIAFGVGADDADELSRQFDKHFTPEQLTGLRQYEIALRLPKREGNPPYPFKGYTLAGRGSRLRCGSPRQHHQAIKDDVWQATRKS